ncbi:uncharacterized protein LOC143036080 [Oratosquilla oratoria]|uniref:uncharacterized protein LOC143036080 n=1 Tax=Oratosquilla oratoria TaxID=337810 RepID=UPI003F76A1FC
MKPNDTSAPGCSSTTIGANSTAETDCTTTTTTASSSSSSISSSGNIGSCDGGGASGSGTNRNPMRANNSRTMKAKKEEKQSEEMKIYLEKLKDMVPYVPRDRKISKVDLIHCAIDYISDLQGALEARAKKRRRSSQESQPSRQPFSILPSAEVEPNAPTPATAPQSAPPPPKT